MLLPFQNFVPNNEFFKMVLALQKVISITEHLQYLKADKLKLLREIDKLTRKVNNLDYNINVAQSDVIRALQTKKNVRGRLKVRKNANTSKRERMRLRTKRNYGKIKGKKVNKKKKKRCLRKTTRRNNVG